MSLRQQAKILGVHHSTLSKCINGQRKWKPELKERYEQLVATMVADSGDISGAYGASLKGNRNTHLPPHTGTNTMYNDISMQCGAVAHLGERFNGIEEVRGSSPRSSTIGLALGVKQVGAGRKGEAL